MIAKRPAYHDPERSDALLLTNDERWIIREMLSAMDADDVEMFVGKCEKMSLTREDAEALADVFDIAVPAERWARYSAAY